MKVDKEQILCVIVGITFLLAGIFVDSRNEPLLNGYEVKRNSYGRGELEQEVIVDGIFEKSLTLPLSLRERQYTEEEAMAVFDKSLEKLVAEIMGENESLESVSSDLKLISRLEEEGIDVEWSSEDPELVDSTGTVQNEACRENGQPLTLTACMRAGGYKKEYPLSLVVYPPKRTAEEIIISGFQALVEQLDEVQAETDRLLLPDSYEGQPLRYHIRKSGDYWLFPVLGVVAAAFIPVSKRQKAQKERQKKEQQMRLDYSDIVSRLVVFTGAGLPVRRAWEQIVRDYEVKSHKEGTCRYAYEEMKAVYYLMERGMPEIKAYSEFGDRCRILPYRKLSGLLEQNLKNGNANLKTALVSEMADAFEQRKTMARRLGEEAGTKLLIPLFMMLAVVMVIVSVPAFLSFSV